MTLHFGPEPPVAETLSGQGQEPPCSDTAWTHYKLKKAAGGEAEVEVGRTLVVAITSGQPTQYEDAWINNRI